jgi:tetratricopeptide (TPR) repeat protein
MFECYRTKKLIKRIVIGEELSAFDTQRLQMHLVVCSQCKQRFEREQELDRFIQQGFNAFQPQRDITADVLAQIESESIPPAIKEKPEVVARLNPIRIAWVSAIIIIGILLSILIPKYYSQYTRQIIVKDIRGNGLFIIPPGETQWQQIKPGMKLVAGSQIATNKWCQAELQSRSGLRIWLNWETRIQLAMDTAYSISIPKGEIYLQKPLQKRAFKIKTPAGIAEPIGTSLNIRVDGTGTTKISVIVGKVQLNHSAGATVIPALYQTTAETAQKTIPKLERISAPDSVINWINEFNEVIREPVKTRAQLAREAYNLGYKYFDAKEFYAAVTSFQLVVKYEPDWWQGYVGLAHGYFGLKQFKEAYIASKNAFKLEPNHTEVRYVYMLCLIPLGRDAEALPHAEWLVKTDPNDHAYSVAIGDIYRHLGRLDEAEFYYHKTLDQKPCDICRLGAEQGLEKVAKKRAESN